MKLTFRSRLFLYFFCIFALFTLSIVFLQQRGAKKHRVEVLSSKLDGYADLIGLHLSKDNLEEVSSSEFEDFINVFPKNIRVTIIDIHGKVIYDRQRKNVQDLDNHISRPEIMMAQYQKKGVNIRLSTTTNDYYIYYAKLYNNTFVRVALPYNMEVEQLLEPDRLFLYVVAVQVIIALMVLYFIAGRFSNSIQKLKFLATRIKNGKKMPTNLSFPNDELGDIGAELFGIFKNWEKSKQKLEMEKEKLERHFRFSEEGISMFSSKKECLYFNTHFIQLLNLISDKPILSMMDFFGDKVANPIREFLEDKERSSNHQYFNINKKGRHFSMLVAIFEDKSFEIILKDVTKAEKTKLLKQEMTNNIAHELRTPVTSLRGYLETLCQSDLSQEKRDYYLSRAHLQSIRLSTLIQDISLLNKIEDTNVKFQFEPVSINDFVINIAKELENTLAENNIKTYISINEELVISGNKTLLYSIFRNLIDNSIKYAGKGVDIYIVNYMEDERFAYFSYYDTGTGVEEAHLSRLFERFYRGDEGRSSETGGTGLGLSIVRNAVQLHKGEIDVKNRKGAGLEFLFTLKK